MANETATRPLTAEALGRIARQGEVALSAERKLYRDPLWPYEQLDAVQQALCDAGAAAVAAAVLGAVEAIVRDRIYYADVADPTFLSVPENLHWNDGYRVACVGIVEDLGKLAIEVAGG